MTIENRAHRCALIRVCELREYKHIIYAYSYITNPQTQSYLFVKLTTHIHKYDVPRRSAQCARSSQTRRRALSLIQFESFHSYNSNAHGHYYVLYRYICTTIKKNIRLIVFSEPEICVVANLACNSV